MFMTLPFASVGMKFAPLLHYDHNNIDFQLVTEECGRFGFLKYLLDYQSGSHFETGR